MSPALVRDLPSETTAPASSIGTLRREEPAMRNEPCQPWLTRVGGVVLLLCLPALALTPYGLAHAQSSNMHVQIELLRRGIAQITNPFALTLLNQQLNLRYQEATALDVAYRTLTARKASPTTVYNTLVSLDAAFIQA